MKNKKGFTLVELLAVIVIMAILALIAIPITISIISDSRENSHKRSIENYGREVEKALVQAKIDKKITNNISDLKDYIKTSGEKVKCDDDQIYINDGKDKLQNSANYDNIYLKSCYVIDDEEKIKSKKYDYVGGQLKEVGSEENDNKYKAYHIEDEIFDKQNNEKYYVISDSNEKQDYVVALKSDPLTVDEINQYGDGYVNVYSYPESSEYRKSYNWNDDNNTGGMYYYSDETCGFYGDGWRDYCKNEYQDSHVKHVVDNWANAKFQNDELKQIDDYFARLITYEELRMKKQQICYDTCFEREFVGYDFMNPNNAYWYWTMSTNNDDGPYLWGVSENGNAEIVDVYHGMVNGYGAVRPVINLRKEFIK